MVNNCTEDVFYVILLTFIFCYISSISSKPHKYQCKALNSYTKPCDKEENPNLLLLLLKTPDEQAYSLQTSRCQVTDSMHSVPMMNIETGVWKHLQVSAS